MTKKIKVVKYDGSSEDLDLDKISKVIGHASKGLKGISESDVMMSLDIQLYDGIATDEIQRCLIEAAHNHISLENPDYEVFASRLVVFRQRKQAFNSFYPPGFYDFVKSMVERGHYDESILDGYSKKEIKKLGDCIDHNRDLNFRYAGIKQLEEKCLIRDRDLNVLETPQFMYMLIPMYFHMYMKDKKLRMQRVIEHYNNTSRLDLSHPTPINAGARTKVKQYSSCVLFDLDCTLESQLYGYHSLGVYASQRAGAGVNIGRIRAYGDSYQGSKRHPGPASALKIISSYVQNVNQGNRGAAATTFAPFFHKDIFDILSMKNNRGREENRARNLDYCMQVSRLFYRRFLSGGNISLFSPNDVRDLYEAFFRDEDEFEALYCKYEGDNSVPKVSIPAKELMDKFLIERAQTGRIYLFNSDHVNSHGSFIPSLAPIYMSNLCMEITLPTRPLKSFLDVADSEIAVCTLMAVNLGNIKQVSDLESPLRSAVYSLDALLDYQEYPVPQSEYWAKKRRALGVGVVGFAHYLAKRGLRFGSQECLNETHRLFEAFQFYLIKASMELAKEKGPCELYEQTKYSKGLFPIDTYCKNLDEVCSEPLHMDWDWLKGEVKKYGLRNSTLSSLMPSETSSQVVQSTDGINQPKSALTIKGAKDSSKRQIVPEYESIGGEYDYKFTDKDNKRFLRTIAVMQKFVDQSISTNTSYNPLLYPDNKVPTPVIVGDVLYAYHLGLKTLYYQYTKVDDDLLRSKMSAAKSAVDSERVRKNDIVEIDGQEECESCTV